MATNKMIRSIFYKEWLKTRYAVLGILVLGLAAVGYIFFVDVRGQFASYGAFDYVNSVLYGVPQQNYYIRIVRYLPLSVAMILGLTQYVPEVLDKRIKLTYHLPLRNQTSVFLMLLYGFGMLLTIYIVIFGTFFIFNNYHFPGEETVAVLISVTPWILGGVAAYFMIATIAMEPNMLYQFLYTLAAYMLIIPLFYIGQEHGDTVRVLWKLAIMAFLPSIGIFFTSKRFMKGER